MRRRQIFIKAGQKDVFRQFLEIFTLKARFFGARSPLNLV